MRSPLISILLFVFICLKANGGDLSFHDAVLYMTERNGELKSAALTLEEKSLLQTASYGLHFPTVTVGAKYTHMNDELQLKAEIPLPQQLGGPRKLKYTLQDQNFLKANISLTWPLFTGGKVMAAGDAAAAEYNNALSDYNIARNDMLNNLVSKYFAMQLAIETSKLRNEVLKGLELHYENAVSQENAGVIPRVERLHAEVSMNEAERDFNKSLKDIEIAFAALRSLINIDYEPTLTSSLFVLNPAYIEPLDYFKTVVVTSSPRMNKLDAFTDLAQAGMRAKRATYMPNVYVYGDYELYKAQLTMNDPEWFVGIGVSWDIFEGFTGHHNYLASLKTQESVNYRKMQAVSELEALVEVYYKQMLKAYDEYAAAKNSLEFTTEYLRVRTKSFQSGLATSIDVVNAQTALSKNKLDIMLAAYDFDIALSNLLSVCGQSDKFEGYSNNINVEIIK